MRFSTFSGMMLITCLMGCDSDNGKNTPIVDDPIVLKCNGEGIDQDKREPLSYLIKIHPGNEFQRSLHFYSDEQKRFISPCEDRGFTCELSVGSDLITEIGEMSHNGQITLRKLTEINRRTGLMRVALQSSLPLNTIFEGQCVKGEMPPEQAAKF